jgi:hypothetical protein
MASTAFFMSIFDGTSPPAREVLFELDRYLDNMYSFVLIRV